MNWTTAEQIFMATSAVLCLSIFALMSLAAIRDYRGEYQEDNGDDQQETGEAQ